MTSHTNNTNRFQVVANAQHILSQYGTRAEATEWLQDQPAIEDAPFAVMEVVAPGQTVSVKIIAGLTQDQIDANAGSDIFSA